MMRCRTATAAPIALLLLVLSACGPARPAVAPVTGRITRDGKPVTSGAVTFYPAAGRPAAGQIDTDGRYTLGTFSARDGAILGGHRVVIEARTVAVGKPRPVPKAAPAAADMPEAIHQEWEAGLAAGSAQITWLVPETYASQSTTPLRAEVHHGQNVVDFDIPSATK